MKRLALVMLCAVFAAFVAPFGATFRADAQDKDPARRDFQTYRLRVEDEIEISVYNRRNMRPEIQRELVIPATGEVSFAPVGKISLLGRTTTEVEETIAQRLRDDNYMQEPIVGCFVKTYAPRSVAIVGAAQGVVELPTHRDLRILELLARAGTLGVGQVDYSRVVVRRMGQDGRPFPIEINVEDILDRNQEEKNIVVREGDMIRVYELQSATSVTSAEFVYVIGKVGSPGRHPIIRGRTPFTITKLIAICGDFAEFADHAKVRVIRTTETGRQFKELDFDDIIEGKTPDFELRPDDFVYVPERIF